MTGAVTVDAPAKLNLVLRVGPRRPDGYHPVATLMVALDGLADEVVLTRAQTRTLECPGAPAGPDNLAWHAADALERYCGRALPAHISIDKRIPMQAGLGGGSSDAAAVLVGLDRVYGLGLTAAALETIAAGLGSDVPFFVRGGAQWATGRGETLSPQPLPRDLWVVVCAPVAALSTAAVYAAFDTRGTAAPIDTTPPRGPWRDGGWAVNDLWPAARALAPALDDAARHLAGAGADRVLLCGSGGAIAGLWHDQAAAGAAAARIPGVIAVASPLVPRPA
jgi:4-diphosphocytidyl-2-C-methyl-D-erythritol kinase